MSTRPARCADRRAAARSRAKPISSVAVFVVLATLVGAVGCRGGSAARGGADPHLSLLAKLYADHLNANQGAPPADEAQFKNFIREHGAHRLADVGLGDLDALFVSTRDNQQLIVFYGSAASHPQTAVIGYERTAVDGKRTVGYRHGSAELVDDVKFTDLVPAEAPGE